jgi:hypothetical protein
MQKNWYKHTSEPKGICVQTKLIHGGSLLRIADGLMSTSHWKLRFAKPGDEVSVFRKKQKGDSISSGTIESVIEHGDGRVTIIFWEDAQQCVKRKVMPERNSHYYVLKDSNYRQ